MYKAIVNRSYGTGAPQHKYWGGTGVAISKSPKRAVEMARKMADHKCGEGACWVPVWDEITIIKDGKVVYHDK